DQLEVGGGVAAGPEVPLGGGPGDDVLLDVRAAGRPVDDVGDADGGAAVVEGHVAAGGVGGVVLPPDRLVQHVGAGLHRHRADRRIIGVQGQGLRGRLAHQDGQVLEVVLALDLRL